MVVTISTMDEWNEHVINASGPVVVDFFAQWCGPCRMMGPKFVKMADVYPDVKFVKVDVDDLEELAEDLEISAMPTFHVYFMGVKKLEMVGTSEQKLKEMVENAKEKRWS